jgi:Outer membrane protein beta-barrel domain
MQKILLLICTFFITALAGAQIQFGAKAGLNLSNLSVSPSSSLISYNNKAHFNAGLLVLAPVSGNFKLQGELLYSGQGTDSKIAIASTNYKLQYLNVPVLLKYADQSGFFAEIGPQLGFLLSAKAVTGNLSTDAKSLFKSTDFSGVLGIGYLSQLKVGIDARYNLGLSKIGDGSFSNTTIKNKVFQVSLFYLFGESRKK